MNTEKIFSIIAEKEKQYNFNDYIKNYIKIEEFEKIKDIQELRTYLEELDQNGDITKAEVIFYLSAMDYLRENDPSLNESFEIAEEYGFSINKLNSEILASLLKSKYNEDDFSEFIDAVINSVEELDEEVF